MDCCSSHVSVRTLRLVRKLKWRILAVPSTLTFLLQPLDAYVFNQFKRRLQETHVSNRIDTPDGDQPFEKWSRITFESISNTFGQLKSKPYFEKCGCSIPSNLMSDTVHSFVNHAELGKHRKLTKHELSTYMGINASAHHPYFFPTCVPTDWAAKSISVKVPTHRLTSKKSLEFHD